MNIAVDWRNRFGHHWISSVRDQGNSQNCWAFAMTALYEAMVRIEHGVWCRRSEGDIARGAGKQSWNTGNLGEAAIFAQRYGVADPDCFAWTEAAALYTSKPHAGDMRAFPLSPTPDRSGRTLRVGSVVGVTDPVMRKVWLDTVGPMAVMFPSPVDLGGLHNGIYSSVMPATNGNHAVLVIGYDDEQQCWIVKNSWGTAWGEGGFGRIGYAAHLLEPHTFYGIRNTNPDPWTKRRVHNGTLIQSGNGGRHNNLELFLKRGLTLEHWWHDPNTMPLRWNRAGVVRSADPWAAHDFQNDVLDCPAVIQSTFNRNYEVIYRSTYGRQLRHIYRDQASGWWFDATLFGPYNPVGIPGFVQGTRGAPGDFEVVVLTQSGHLEHWAKHNSAPWSRQRRPGSWYHKASFGANIQFSGPALVHSRSGIKDEFESDQGELHYVCTGVDGMMHHFRKQITGNWELITSFGTSLSSGPCMIESQQASKDELKPGSFELCVTSNGQIEHWSRSNTPLSDWSRKASFGSEVRRVVGMQETFRNRAWSLQLIVERMDGRYQHYRQAQDSWVQGIIIG